MAKLLMTLLLLSLWRVEFATGQNFDCSNPNGVRINQADYFGARAGRVEICSCNLPVPGCQWLTIPVPTGSVSWGWKNALVACREAYPEDYGVINPILQDTLVLSLTLPPYVYSSFVSCDGSEDRIIDCSLSPSSNNFSRDAYVRCRTDVPIEGDVRLAGYSSNNYMGLVEFYVAGRGWVNICGDSWDIEDANVTCVTLGYDSGIPYFLPTETTDNTRPIGVNDVSCSGTELELVDCSYSTLGLCSESSFLAGVSCTSSVLPDGTVRLFPSQPDGFNQRVEVLYDDRWGSVCDFGWDIEDGMVACSTLGDGEAQIESDPTFSTENSVRPIWLAFVDCDGSESSLSACSTSSAVGYQSSCDHSDDAALACVDGGLSGGEIAGIVIGVLCFLGLVGLFFHINEKNKKKQATERQRRQQEAASAAVVRINAARAETDRVEAIRNAREGATTTNTAEPANTSTSDNASALPRVESDTELRRGAPPSYNDAIHFTEAFSGTKNDPPPTNTSEQSAQPEATLPPYPFPETTPSNPTTGNSSLPYPDTSNASTPYPPVSSVGVPYPHADIASAPYPPSSNVQTPYPQEPAPGNFQGYPPPTNPGCAPPTNPNYPPPTNPNYPPSTNLNSPPPANLNSPPPTNPAFPPSAPFGYPPQPFITPAYHPNQPIQDVGAPLPPVLQPHEETNF